MEDRAVILFKEWQLDKRQLKQNMMEEEDLEKLAREYGLDSYRDCRVIVLEGDGSLTGSVREFIKEKPKDWLDAKIFIFALDVHPLSR